VQEAALAEQKERMEQEKRAALDEQRAASTTMLEEQKKFMEAHHLQVRVCCSKQSLFHTSERSASPPFNLNDGLGLCEPPGQKERT
jgi:hypothetical protein